MFTGCYTALVTPFKEGKVDEDVFAQFVEWQIGQGVHGVVPSGTTGESPTLSHDEHNRVIEVCVEAVAGRVPVIAGTGSNATGEAIMMTQHAQKVGADAALVVCPYYNKPTQEGIYQHYKAIHDVTEIPLILYDVPGRTVVEITDETVQRLAELPRVIGIKDATGDLARPGKLRAACGEEFVQLSGEDDTVVEFNEQGGQGVISVTANVTPAACSAVQTATLEGDWEAAKAKQAELMDLHNIMFCETSPGPAKYGVSLLGHCDEEMRLPLVPPAEENKVKIRAVMEGLGLV